MPQLGEWGGHNTDGQVPQFGLSAVYHRHTNPCRSKWSAKAVAELYQSTVYLISLIATLLARLNGHDRVEKAVPGCTMALVHRRSQPSVATAFASFELEEAMRLKTCLVASNKAQQSIPCSRAAQYCLPTQFPSVCV